MLVLPSLDTQEKINLLARAAHFDVSGPDESGSLPSAGQRDLTDRSDPTDRSGGTGHFGDPAQGSLVAERLEGYITRPVSARGPLLKVLMNDACHNNCRYCAFRAGSDRPRTAFRPEELATAFAEMYARGRASGLFLSSGLAGDPRRAMEEMLKAAEMLRGHFRYPGYLHLKILPGATDEYIEAACRLADRVSSNLEAPNEARLATLCPEKSFDSDLLSPMLKVERIRRRGGILPYGQITQFVVGAAGESDRELLETTGRLYREVRLARAHFSAFTPLPGTPLEGRPRTSPIRQHRLYQADSLLRQYGFSPDELPTGEDGNLPQDRDPKQEWARLHPERFPIEVNRATRAELLRVPGIGPRGASAILRARGQDRLRTAQEMNALGILLSRAAPFLLADGKRLAGEAPVQLALW